MLELRRPTAVAGNDRPIVGPLVAIGTALRYHRLDREDHTGQELHFFVVAEMLYANIFHIIVFGGNPREKESVGERKSDSEWQQEMKGSMQEEPKGYIS